jgi:Tol biopolymer transport system component
VLLVCCSLGAAVLLRQSAAAGSRPTRTSIAGSHTLFGRIVFARVGGRYGEETIFVARADGSHQRRLSKFGASCCARISRDATHVLLAAPGPGGRITTEIVSVDGSASRRIVLPDQTLNLGPGAWSWDGQEIAFQAWDDSNTARNGIYIGRSSDGGNLTRVTSGVGAPGDFSPDGSRLAFYVQRPNTPPGQPDMGSVWVVNVNGTHLKQLTPTKMAVDFGTIRWSPDGTKILFATVSTRPRGGLWTVHPDGTHLASVFKNRPGRYALSPTWSPSGRLIMFALDPSADEESHPANGLYVMNSNGTGLAKVIGGQDFKREPDWVR